MTNPSENEREQINNQIFWLKEQIWETKAYISSDFCIRCTDMYNKIHNLELELNKLISKQESING